MAKQRLFSLRAGHWFAYQLIPGPGPEVCSYFSPVLVLEATSDSAEADCCQVRYFDAFHPGSGTTLERDLHVLRRTGRYLLASVGSGGIVTEESALVCEISFEWLARFAPRLLESRPPHTMGAAAAGVQFYLHRLYT